MINPDRSVIIDDNYGYPVRVIVFKGLKATKRIDIKEGSDKEQVDVYVDGRKSFFTSLYTLRNAYLENNANPQYYVALLINMCNNAVNRNISSISMFKGYGNNLKIRVTVD